MKLKTVRTIFFVIIAMTASGIIGYQCANLLGIYGMIPSIIIGLVLGFMAVISAQESN